MTDIYPLLKCVRGCATDEQFQQLCTNVEKAMADERERCALIAEAQNCRADNDYNAGWDTCASQIAFNIRNPS
jgi:hypothetical protein